MFLFHSPRLPMATGLAIAVLAMVAGCSGGTQDDGNARLAAATDGTSSDTARMPADAAATGNDVAAAAPARDTDGEYPQAAAPDTTPPVAPHPTRLMMLDDGLYARDEQNNWRKLENGSWVSVQAPQGVAAQ